MTKQTASTISLKDLPLKSLYSKIQELKKDYHKTALMQSAGKGSKDVHQPSKKRKEIARAKTYLNLQIMKEKLTK